jgi:RHS repeat-associated protein
MALKRVNRGNSVMERLPQSRRAAIAVLVAALIASVSGTARAADPSQTPAPSGSVNPVGPGGGGPAPAGILSGTLISLPHDGTIRVQSIRSLAAVSIDDLTLAQPVVQGLIADAAHVATTVTVGTFTTGTNLVFSLHSSFTSQDYPSTGDHARVTQDGPERWTIGWEDWTDFNYGDVTTIVCYEGPEPGCPRPPEATFGSGSFDNGASAQGYTPEPVNTATGNYVTQATDAQLPGRGIAVDVVRSYNSLSNEVGALGLGWTHSFEARIVPYADGSATVVAEDGARTTYASDGAGGFLRPPGAYGILAAVGGGYELLRRDQVRLAFDSSGRLVSQTDRNGNAVTLGYTAGQLTTITDTVGRTVTLTYDPGGRLQSLTFPPSRTVGYTYTPSGQLETVTDARGGVTTYGYDAADRLETVVDQNNHTLVTNTYGPDGRVAEQVDARGFHTTFDWDPLTGTSTMTDARGGEWVDDYDTGILMSRSDPLGNVTSYAFDANLSMSALIDPRGLKIETTVDTFGSPTLVKYPGPTNYSEAWTYSARNDPLTHRDRRGNTTTYTYDAAGNLKTVRGPAPVSPLTTFNYDPSGNGLLTSVVDPRTKTTAFGYDATANRNRITTPLGFATTMTYDPGGRMLTLVDPRGNVTGADPAQYTTTFTYDAANHLRTTTSPLGHVTTVDYDPAGNRTAVIDANTHATTFEYDEANHLTDVVDALTNRTEYAYDETGNLVARTDANTHVTTYAYDLAGRLASETRPLGRVWTYEYDADSNITKVIDAIASATPDPNDYKAVYTYNELNRLATAFTTTTGQVTYANDGNGNRTSMTDIFGTSSYTYDVLNRLTVYQRDTHQLTYAYDAAGNLTSRTFVDGSVEPLTYDDDGRFATAAGGGATTTYGYDPAGNLVSTTLPAANGYVESRTYDRSGRLTEVTNQKGVNVLSRATYTLDPVGNRLSTQTTTETATYAYDVLNQLTEVCYTVACTGPGDNFRTYTYDPVGNRLTEVRDTGTTTSTYDAADQLTATAGPGGSVAYTYDLDGRTQTAGSAVFAWAQPDRLQSITQGSTTTVYRYDGDGLRLQASTGSQANKKTNYEWDINAGGVPELVAERTGNGGLIRRYVNGLATISMTAGNKTAYYHYDGLGSVVNLTSSTGALWWTYGYLPYGDVRTETKNYSQAPANLLRFGGEYLDPTALYHLRARQYDPGTGRFLSTDAAPAATADPYVTAYMYANNDPVRFVDPSGRCPLVFVGAIIGGLLGSIVPVAGTGAGASAGAATVGFVLCAAETTVEVIAISNASQVTVPWVPDSGPHYDPDTGDQLPSGNRCGSLACRARLIALTALLSAAESQLPVVPAQPAKPSKPPKP